MGSKREESPLARKAWKDSQRLLNLCLTYEQAFSRQLSCWCGARVLGYRGEDEKVFIGLCNVELTGILGESV